MFARWLYPDGEPYNPADENDGLFQGHYLIYVSSILDADNETSLILIVIVTGVASHLHISSFG